MLIVAKDPDRLAELCLGARQLDARVITPEQVTAAQVRNRLVFCDYRMYRLLSRKNELRKHPAFPIDVESVPEADRLLHATMGSYISALKDYCYGVFRQNQSISVRFGSLRAPSSDIEAAVRAAGCGLLGLAMARDRGRFNHLKRARLSVAGSEWFELIGEEDGEDADED